MVRDSGTASTAAFDNGVLPEVVKGRDDGRAADGQRLRQGALSREHVARLQVAPLDRRAYRERQSPVQGTGSHRPFAQHFGNRHDFVQY